MVFHDAVFKELTPPFLKIQEGISISQIENQHTAIGSFVENRAQTLKSLLPSRVPNLQGQCHIIHCYLFRYEISPHCSFVGAGELFTRELLEQGCFAHAGITQDDHLEEVLMLHLLFFTNRLIGLQKEILIDIEIHHNKMILGQIQFKNNVNSCLTFILNIIFTYKSLNDS